MEMNDILTGMERSTAALNVLQELLQNNDNYEYSLICALAGDRVHSEFKKLYSLADEIAELAD